MYRFYLFKLRHTFHANQDITEITGTKYEDKLLFQILDSMVKFVFCHRLKFLTCIIVLAILYTGT